ncbi:MAG: VOC family protein [Desulfobacterales bacterium]|nr:VOC family protein [Desulfobacterales bacterium]
MLPMYTRNALYKHVDHVAVVVNNIERAADFYRDVFQLDLIMGLSYPPDGVHTNLVFSLGPENELELMGPLGDRGFIVDFLKKHGQGVHHLAIEVTDIDQVTAMLEQNGIRIFGRTEFKGMRFTFLHPASTLRVGMQLMQRKPQKQSHDPLIKGLDHVAIRVSNPDGGRDFFLHGLGAEQIAKGKDDLINCTCERFLVGNTRFDLLYVLTGPSPAALTDGLHHLAVKVDDLPAAMRHFKQFDIDRLAPCSDERGVFLSQNNMFGCLWRVMQG